MGRSGLEATTGLAAWLRGRAAREGVGIQPEYAGAVQCGHDSEQ